MPHPSISPAIGSGTLPNGKTEPSGDFSLGRIGYQVGNTGHGKKRPVMTIFAVLLPIPQPAIVEAIKRVFPNDHLSLNDTQWLISANGTVIDISTRLGISDPKNPQAAIGNAVIFATTAYFGRAPTNTWDWLKTKLESPPSG
jgi:hypothetical protein